MSLSCDSAVTRDDGNVILELTQVSHEFVFTGVTERPVLSLNRGFSAPVNIDYEYTNDELALLMVHDSDPVARWNASQLLSQNAILTLAERIQQGGEPEVDQLLVDTWRQVLRSANQDGSLLAQLCSLPMINYLLRQSKQADVAALFAAKSYIMTTLSSQLQTAWKAEYENGCSSDPYQYDVEGMSRRAWKNQC